MNQPLWVYSEWWTEYRKDSKEHKHRLSDFIQLVKENGLPIIPVRWKQNSVEIGNEVVFATEDCEKEVNLGSPESPDIKIVCKWCGQIKEDFITAWANKKGTKSHGLVPVISPDYPESGMLNSKGNRVWGKCPHIKAWQGKGTGKGSFR